jgi:eukaryotic translation initiation factor 2C
MVNVNVCYTAFYKEQNLAQAMLEFASASYGGLADKFVEGVRVTPTHVSQPSSHSFLSLFTYTESYS